MFSIARKCMIACDADASPVYGVAVVSAKSVRVRAGVKAVSPRRRVAVLWRALRPALTRTTIERDGPTVRLQQTRGSSMQPVGIGICEGSGALIATLKTAKSHKIAS